MKLNEMFDDSPLKTVKRILFKVDAGYYKGFKSRVDRYLRDNVTIDPDGSGTDVKYHEDPDRYQSSLTTQSFWYTPHDHTMSEDGIKKLQKFVAQFSDPKYRISLEIQ